MPSGGEVHALVDTSVSVPLLIADHEHHAAAIAAVRDTSVGLPGHAFFETFSVLTRLPPPHRLAPATALGLLQRDFPSVAWLGARDQQALLEVLDSHRVAGGSVYDALVGWAAVRRGKPLFTCDRRALPVYEAIGADAVVIDVR